MKTGKKIIVLAVLVFIFLPVVTHAFSFWPLVPCGLRVQPTDSSGVELPKVPTQENPYAHDYTQPCNQCDLFKLLKNIIDFVLMGLMPPAAAILFVWGGFLILMGGANPGWITQGKSIFFNTAIGVAIISASWLLTNTIIKSLANESVTNPNTPWYQLECTVTTVGGDGNCSDGIKNGDETGIDTGGRCAVTTGKLYTCNDKEKCVEDPNGKYDNSTCDDVCAPATTNLTISTSSLSDASQGSDYSQDLSATGGTAPYTWTLDTSTPLPAGLSLEYRGTIYGKPTETGDFTFTVLLNDSKGETANKDLSIKVVAASDSVVISNVASSKITADSATITWTTNKPSTSQVAYGTTTAYGSPTPIDDNLVTNHSVTISGLNGNTTYNYQAISSITEFTARSPNNDFKTLLTSHQFSILISLLPDAVQGAPYSETIPLEGGQGPYTFTIGTLPEGLKGNPVSGEISGTPTTPGTTTVTVKVEDSSTPKKTVTKPLTIKVKPSGQEAICKFTGVNLCQAKSMTCSASSCSQYVGAINKYAGKGAPANLIKAIMIKESTCNISADSGHAYGLMQLVPATANIYKSFCGVTENITSAWLKTPANASASICIASIYMTSLSETDCGGPNGDSIRGIAAGYNGGSGACNPSVDCKNDKSCEGSSVSVKRWECLYDDTAHKTCNTGYDETRDYAVKVLYCYNNPGF